MSERIYNVLFLCTGNSTRSIMAEALLNTMVPNFQLEVEGNRCVSSM